MSNFTTLSSILKGVWLLEPGFAKSQLPLVLQMLKRDDAGSGSVTGAINDRASSKPSIEIPVRRSIVSSTTDLFAVYPYTSMDRLPYNSIVVVDILGPVLKYGGMCSYGSMDYAQLFTRLANSEKVNGIIVNIDTPGGQAAGTALLAATIKEVSAKKPVIGICQDGIVASAGMWIASAFREFYVSQITDQVGSIGAYQTIYDFAGHFELNGIKIHEIYAPQSGDKNKDYRDALAGDYALMEADLKFLVQDFINTVKTNRGPRLNTSSENPFTGKMYNAAEAKAIGLIDGIKPMAGVVKRMQQLISLRP